VSAPQPIRRRRLPLLGAALAVAPQRPAAAQVGAVVRLPPMPCATRPGDITGMLLEGNGTTTETITVFGQAFRPGDLPRDRGLAARTAEGQPLRAQLDVKTRHPDGSARFGVVSLAAPPLRSAARLGVVLSAAAGAATAPLDLARALAGRQPVVEIIPAAGTPWRAELAAMLAGQRSGPAVWQSGPLATQLRATAWVPPDAVGGVTSLRLVADVGVRADGSLWLDLWLRNDATMRAGGGAAAYGVRVMVEGQEVLRAEGMQHAQYTAWGRQLRVAAGGQAPAPPFPQHDAAYLAETGAVARYDLSVGVEEALLNRYATAVSAPAWAVVLGARNIAQYMPATGDRPDIGPATESQAAWLLTGDRRAAAYSLGQAEAAGSIPWHHWDPAGGVGGQGGWIDQRRWPRLWTDARGGPPPGGLMQPMPTNTGWSLDQAHQPDLSFVPFLLTGRRSFLDALQAQAAWNIVAVWPAVRGAPDGAAAGDGAIILRDRQVRSAAWSIRQLDEAAWITPDDDPGQEYFRWLSKVNWAWLKAQIPAMTAMQGEVHGWLPGAYGSAGSMAPWQQDYFAFSTAAAARRGNADAHAVLVWMDNFLSGRFLAKARGFPRRDGVAYNLAIAPTGSSAQPFRRWAEIAEATRARSLSNGDGWSQSNGNYGRLAVMTLASLQDVIGSAGAREAYAWLIATDLPNIRLQVYARSPTLNVMPRGQPRQPDRAPRCAGG
jgi:hypothetical protein